MLSPKRTTRRWALSTTPTAVRIHEAIFARTRGSVQWPATTLRGIPMRVIMCPNSRSPWADWFVFMKSMSMSANGISRLNCVCRCISGLRQRWRPWIHIFAGEKVCIQRITPAHFGSSDAACSVPSIERESMSVGFQTTGKGSAPEALRPATISCEWAATVLRHSSP